MEKILNEPTRYSRFYSFKNYRLEKYILMFKLIEFQ